MTARRRRGHLGIFGLPSAEYDSDFDEDYEPGENPNTPASPAAATQIRRGAARATKHALVEEHIDAPLAARRSKRQRRPAAVYAPSSAAVERLSSDTVPGSTGHGDVAGLPSDVLRIILQAACRRAALPVAVAARRVCRHWRGLVDGLPELWSGPSGLDVHLVHGALTDAVVQTWAASGRWRELRHVRLDGRPGQTDAALLALSHACPHLATVDLTGSTTFRRAGLEAALQAMPSLTALIVSDCIVQPSVKGLDVLLHTLLDPVKGQEGQHHHRPRGCSGLVTLRAVSCPTLSNGTFKALCPAPPPGHVYCLSACPSDATSSLPAVPPAGTALPDSLDLQPAAVSLEEVSEASASGAALVPQAFRLPPPLFCLRELDLTDSARASSNLALQIERFQAAAPNLEVLKLNGFGGVFGWGAAPPSSPPHPAWASAGFPKLLVCELAASRVMSPQGLRTCFSKVTNHALARLLGKSARLRVLNLSDQTQMSLSTDIFESLDCPLRTLCITRSTLAADASLVTIAAKYGSTLQVLEAGGGVSRLTDVGVAALAACAGLTSLDISGSSVTDLGLTALLKALPAPGGSKDAAAAAVAGSMSATAAADDERGQGTVGGTSGAANGTADGMEGRSRSDGRGGTTSGLCHLNLEGCRGVDRPLRAAAATSVHALYVHLFQAAPPAVAAAQGSSCRRR